MPLEMKYFVLKPQGKNPYAKASREAMIIYARSIKNIDPELSQSLVKWVNLEIENLASDTNKSENDYA